MVRDVFDVAYSYGSMEIHGRTGRYLEGARRWQDAYAKILRFSERHSDQMLIVSYERLVEDPAVATREVAGYLGLPYRSPVPVTGVEASDFFAWSHLSVALNDVQTDSVGRGRAYLRGPVKKRIAVLTNDLQARLGYHPGERPGRRPTTAVRQSDPTQHH